MKEENIKFKQWYSSLKLYQQRFAARQIMEACGISRPTLMRWLEGDSEIKNPYRIVINGIAGEKLFPTDKIIPVASI